MIKTRIKSQIENALTNEHFNKNDFCISFETRSDSTFVKIEYEYDSTFFINLNIPNSKKTFSLPDPYSPATKESFFDYNITGVMKPGEVSFSEQFNSARISSIYSHIKDWLNNLWEELISRPVERYAKLQSDEIEKLKEKANNIDDEYFTKEEADDLKLRLEKIEKDFAAKIKELEEDKKIAAEQIKNFKEQIEVLKQTIPSLKKRGWFKSFITKTMTWFADPKNQKLLKAGKDLVSTMIPENTGAN